MFRLTPLYVGQCMHLKQQIQRNATRITELHRRVHETWAERNKGPEENSAWKLACHEFHDNYESLAFPGGTYNARNRMRSGDDKAIEYAITFLEVRPYFFRSGYMYQDFMRVIRNCPLSVAQRTRYDRIREKYLEYLKTRRQSC